MQLCVYVAMLLSVGVIFLIEKEEAAAARNLLKNTAFRQRASSELQKIRNQFQTANSYEEFLLKLLSSTLR